VLKSHCVPIIADLFFVVFVCFWGGVITPINGNFLNSDKSNSIENKRIFFVIPVFYARSSIFANFSLNQRKWFKLEKLTILIDKINDDQGYFPLFLLVYPVSSNDHF
jgi:hypothetical protein